MINPNQLGLHGLILQSSHFCNYESFVNINYIVLCFNRSLQDFHSFVNPIVANGGGDGPEDIMGALKVTLSKLSWRSSAAKVCMQSVFCERYSCQNYMIVYYKCYYTCRY